MFNLWNVLDDVMRTDPWFRPFLMGPEMGSARSWPLVDVAEADAAYFIKAELPGVKLEDVKIEIENNVLTLSAQKHPESSNERHEYHRVERSYGTFSRSFVLPQGVQSDNVQATMKDGVLTIHVPKSDQARPRRIPVRVMGSSASAPPAQLTEASAIDREASASSAAPATA
jgi:HSP20 family protein